MHSPSGQHACNILAKNDIYVDRFFKQNMVRHFCIDPQQLCCMTMRLQIFFLSTRLNDITTEMKYHSTTGEMLEKLEDYGKVLVDLMLKMITAKNSYVLCQAL